MAIKTRLELGRPLTFFELDENFKSARRNAKVYKPSYEYDIDEVVFYDGKIYVATNETTGAFNVSDWDEYQLNLNGLTGLTLQVVTDNDNVTTNDVILSGSNRIYFNGSLGSYIGGISNSTGHTQIVGTYLEIRHLDSTVIYHNGSEKYTFDGTGLGINVSIPQNALDVGGEARIRSLTGATNRVVYAQPSGILNTLDNITTVELGHLSGLTENVQDRFDAIDNGDFQYNTGLISGGTLSINADDTKFDIGPLKGYVVLDSLPTAIEVNYPNGITGITPTYLATNPVTYVAIGVSGVTMSDKPFNGEDLRDNIELGVIVHSNNTNINVVNNLQHILRQPLGQLTDYIYANGSFINMSGNTFSPNGNNLKLNMSSGRVYKEHINSLNNQNEPNFLTLSESIQTTFRYRLQDSTEYSDTTDIDPNNWDNGGVLTAVPSDKYTSQKISIFPSGAVRIQYGQKLYDSLEDAIAGTPNQSFIVEPNLNDNALLRFILCIKEGVTNLNDSKYVKFIEADESGNIRRTHTPGDIYRSKILNNSSTGLLSGGTISINAGDSTKFDITDGAGVIINNTSNPLEPSFKQVYWEGLTNITPTYLATDPITYILIDSDGNVIQQVTDITAEQYRQYLVLGVLIHTQNAVIEGTTSTVKLSFNEDLNTVDLSNAIGAINIKGNVIYPTANLNLNKTSGKTYSLGGNYSNSIINPNINSNPAIAGATFLYAYQDGLGGLNVSTPTTSIDPTKYDDGSGTLKNVSNNKWTIQRVYYYSSPNTLVVAYGQNIYNSVTEAKVAIETETFTLNVPEDQPVRAYLILKGDASDLSNTAEALIFNTGKFGDTSITSAIATGTLQDAYDNSTQPQILTDSAGKALQIKSGTINSDPQFEVLNTSNDVVYSISGNGNTMISGTTSISGNTTIRTLTGSGFRVVYATDGGTLDTLDSITTIELGYLSGLTRNIEQTFIDIFNGSQIVGDSQLLDGLDSSQFIRSDTNDTVLGHTIWQDNYFVALGNGSDLRLYHNSTNSYIDNYNGGLLIRNLNTASSITLATDNNLGNNQTGLVIDGNDSAVSVQLRYNSNLRLVTTDIGVNIFSAPNATTDTDKFMVLDGDSVKYRTGSQILSDIGAAPATGGNYISKVSNDTVSANTTWLDNYELRVGSSADLRLTHNGTNSYLDNYTGTFNFRQLNTSGNINFQYFNGTTTENLLVATPNAGINLYYNNDLKFQTTSTGATVSGDLLITGDLTVQGSGSTFNVDNLTIEDNIILLNKGESGPGVSTGFSGISVDRGLTGGTDSFFFGFDEVRDTLVGGIISGETTSEIANLNAFAQIENNPINLGITYYNSSTNRLETDSGITYDNGKLTLDDYIIFNSNSKGLSTTGDIINFLVDSDNNSVGEPLFIFSTSSTARGGIGASGTYLYQLSAAGGSYVSDKILVADGGGNLVKYLTTTELFDNLGAASSSTTITLTPNNGIIITGGTQDISTNRTWYIGHGDTSSFSMSTLTGANVLSDINVDTFGHVTSVSTRALTPGDIGAAPSTGGNYISRISNDTVLANTIWDDNQYVGFGFNEDLTITHTGSVARVYNNTGTFTLGNIHGSQVLFINNNIAELRIDGNNKVIVGIPNVNEDQNSKFTINVSSGSGITDFLTLAQNLNNASQTSRILWKHRYGTGDFINGQESGYISIERQDTSGTYDMTFGVASTNSTDAQEYMRLTQTGRLGINEVNPVRTLHVGGNAIIDASGSFSGTSVNDLFVYNDGSRNTGRITVESGYQGGVPAYRMATLADDGTKRSGGLYMDAGVSGGSNETVFGFSSDDIDFQLSVWRNQNVFIGTGLGTVPTERLHVDGNLRLTGGLFDSSNSTGTTEYVLTTTTSGTTWRNVDDLVTIAGVSNNAFYRFDNSVGTSPSVNGDYVLNNANPSLATILTFSDITRQGNDISNFLLTLVTIGSTFYIQQDDNASNYYRYTVTGSPIDNVGSVSIPVSYLDGSGTITNNTDVIAYLNTSVADNVVTGLGDVNQIAYWDGVNSITGNTNFIFDGTNMAIGKTTATTRLDVNGVITATGGNSNDWNTAYSWGDHSLEGYAIDSDVVHITGIESITGQKTFTTNITAAGANFTDQVVIINSVPSISFIDSDNSSQITIRSNNGSMQSRVNDTAKNFIWYGDTWNTEWLQLDTNGLKLNDNRSLLLGSSDDLSIYHNGTNSYIDSNTSNLLIRTLATGGLVSIAVDNNAGDNQTVFQANGTGASTYASLRYDNGERLITTDFGINVNGTTNTDNLLVLNNNGSVITALSGYSDYNVVRIAPATNIGSTQLAIGLVLSDTIGFQVSNSSWTATTWNLALQPYGGDVGIGTSAPENKLHVLATDNATNGIKVENTNNGSVTRAALLLESATATGQIYVTPANYTGVSGWADRMIINTDSATSNGLLLRTSNGGISFATTGVDTDDMIILPSTGYVGIGTGTPTSRLHVRDATDISMAANAAGQVEIEGNGYSLSFALDTDAAHIYHNSAGRDLVFGTDETERMRITASGNVGVGTTGPTERLHVNGNVVVNGDDNYIQLDNAGTTGTGGFVQGTGQAGTTAGYGTWLNNNLYYDESAGVFVKPRGATSARAFTSNHHLGFKWYYIPSGGSDGQTYSLGSYLQMTLNNNGDLGIGTDSPDSELHIADNSDEASIILERVDTTVSANRIGAVYFRGGETTIADTASIQVWADGSWTADDSPTYMSFYTTPDSSTTAAEAMRIKADGTVNIGDNLTRALARLDLGNNGVSHLKWGAWSEMGEESSHNTLVLGNNIYVDGSQTKVRYNSTSGYRAIRMKYNEGITFHTSPSAVTVNDLVINERMRINPDGNVGIGTASPTYKLDVGGDFRATGFWTSSSGVSNWGDSTTTTAYGILTWDTGYASIYATSGNELRFGSNSTQNRMKLDVNGNLGIGVSTVTQKLHVGGNVRVTGAYYDSNNSAGTADYILKSTGTGTQWTNINDIGIVDGTGIANYFAVWTDTDTLGTDKLSYAGNQLIWGGASSNSSILYLSAEDDSGSPAFTTGILMVGYEGRGKGIFYTDITTGHTTKEWYSGVPYGDNHNSWQVGYDDGGGQAEYVHNSIIYVNGPNRNVGINTNAPTQPLTVAGNAQIGLNNGANGDLSLLMYSGERLVTDGSTEIFMRAASVSGTSWGQAKIITTAPDNGDGILTFQTSDNNVLTDRMTILPTGNVGINTTNPNNKLTVSTNDVLDSYPIAFNRDNTVGYLYADSSGNGIASSTLNEAGIYMIPNSRIDFRVNGSERMRITSSGTVGIGTTAPENKLQVRSSGNETTGILSSFVEAAGNSFGGTLIGLTSGSGYISINATGGATNVSILANGDSYFNGGNVGMGTTAPSSKLHVSNSVPDGISIENTTSGQEYRLYAGIESITNGGFSISEGLTVRFFIDDGTGNVGIGTSSPSQRLHVDGNLRLTGAYYDSTNSAGSADYILKSTVTGTSWTDINDIGIVDGTGAANQVTFWSDTDTITGTTDFTWDGSTLNINGILEAVEKSFVIDHPTKEGMQLVHGVVEGPEHSVFVRGKLENNNVIELPEYWTGLVDEESITVHLTAIGKDQDLVVDKVESNKVYVKNTKLLSSKINCYYYIMGTRKDVEPLITERVKKKR